ncbi:hypothetical protein CMI37_09490 [Candidatus Pacearchaeota archaeon]|nr:hypothetical protein [Candidatus Pacearchaeota archaeon]
MAKPAMGVSCQRIVAADLIDGVGADTLTEITLTAPSGPGDYKRFYVFCQAASGVSTFKLQVALDDAAAPTWYDVTGLLALSSTTGLLTYFGPAPRIRVNVDWISGTASAEALLTDGSPTSW